MRTLAVGDIHGCRASLEAMAGFVGFSPDDTIVTLGDYIDRGPDSRGVIDFLIDLKRHCRLIHLKGNHEIMVERARNTRLIGWSSVGGGATLESYGVESAKEIPLEHWEFIESCESYFETETHIFVHASVDPDVPLEDQPEFMLFWERFDNPAPHQSGKIMVCGHTSQKSGEPIHLGHAICIDTFAHGGGWLTCLDTESGVIWQTSEAGERRADVIEAFLHDGDL